ncbi:MAG: hypothetical protein COU69_00805 [Candidatus Pacebacteria bacterium CG10_big_fil_rev_8_21_14_0_10_56_10]|nr:MAG: hypothetical protein COU69_00805 [Candidatus Pacebacteria bacterium CG10_big_fil_rev_8_21_14_0_10_56_10]
MMVFDGHATAQRRLTTLSRRVDALAQQGIFLKIAAILYTEDQGSTLYTQLKQSAARQTGIEYEVFRHSLTAPLTQVLANIDRLNRDPTVTGIIIQKPRHTTWQRAAGVAAAGQSAAVRRAFTSWWRLQTGRLSLAKDVDGLYPEVLAAIKAGTWQEQGLVLPATVRAVMSILAEAERQLPEFKLARQRVVILGKSDLLGRPLFFYLRQRGVDVELLGRAGLAQRLEQGRGVTDAGVVISATGHHHLLTGELVAPGAVLVDVGEPRPDINLSSVGEKAAFVTPVPGGVGPMTVVSLLENCLRLAVRRPEPAANQNRPPPVALEAWPD